MKQKIKHFGIGLFIAGLLFSIGERITIPYIQSSSEVATNSKVHEAQKEVKDLKKNITQLENEVKNLNNELKAANVDGSAEEIASTKDNGEESISDTNSQTQSASTDKVVTGTIYVYETVSLYDIGKQAEDLKLVENGRQLELFLSKPEYARSVQKGQFELSSDMTIEQMAKILTGK